MFKRIHLCSGPAPVLPSSDILLSIRDGSIADCSVQHDLGRITITLQITRPKDICVALHDLLASYDFETTMHTLYVASSSQHASAYDVGFLLAALYPDVPLVDEGDGVIDDFVLHALPVREHAEVVHG